MKQCVGWADRPVERGDPYDYLHVPTRRIFVRIGLDVMLKLAAD